MNTKEILLQQINEENIDSNNVVSHQKQFNKNMDTLLWLKFKQRWGKLLVNEIDSIYCNRGYGFAIGWMNSESMTYPKIRILVDKMLRTDDTLEITMSLEGELDKTGTINKDRLLSLVFHNLVAHYTDYRRRAVTSATLKNLASFADFREQEQESEETEFGSWLKEQQFKREEEEEEEEEILN